jgi:hypothetical protein
MVHQIRLEKDRLATEIQVEESETVMKELIELV